MKKTKGLLEYVKYPGPTEQNTWVSIKRTRELEAMIKELTHQLDVSNQANRALNQELAEARVKARKYDALESTATPLHVQALRNKQAENERLQRQVAAMDAELLKLGAKAMRWDLFNEPGRHSIPDAKLKELQEKANQLASLQQLHQKMVDGIYQTLWANRADTHGRP